MSLLSHDELLKALDRKSLEERLTVTPLLDAKTQVGPASIDLRLGTEFIEVRRLAEGHIDPFREERTSLRAREERVVVPLGDHLVLHPGQFVLGATLEFIRMPLDLGGQVLGRSSWGRLGLLVATAVVVQPGFSGSLTLELENMGSVPILLYPGLRIAQLCVWQLSAATDTPYLTASKKYDAPLGPQSSRLGWEGQELERLRRLGRMLKKATGDVSDQPRDD